MKRPGGGRPFGAARRGADSADSGFTLAEFALALGLLAVTFALMAPSAVAVNRSVSTVEGLNSADTAVQPVLVSLGQQVMSASVLYDPVNDTSSYANSGVGAGFALLMYTGPAGAASCVQWRVSSQKLQARSWNPSSPPSSLAFMTVLVGAKVINTASQYPFQLLETSPPQNGALQVNFWMGAAGTSVAIQVGTVLDSQGDNVGTTTQCDSPPLNVGS